MATCTGHPSAAAVIVLPNDRDAVLAAGQAAELTPMVDVEVIPTRNAAEGIAAAVAFERNVTGTDDTLLFAISPWPVVQVFGLEVFASIIAVLLMR